MRFIERGNDLVCCGSAGSVAETLEGMLATAPHLLVTDLHFVHDDIIVFIKRLRAEFPATAILVVSDYEAEIYAGRVLAAGASGFVEKLAPPDELLVALQSCARGDFYLNARLTGLLLRNSGTTGTTRLRRGLNLLSDRELEVFRGIGEGLSTKEIAAVMALSIKTVETYRNGIKRKLALKDGSALMRAAMRWTLDGSLGRDAA